MLFVFGPACTGNSRPGADEGDPSRPAADTASLDGDVPGDGTGGDALLPSDDRQQSDPGAELHDGADGSMFGDTAGDVGGTTDSNDTGDAATQIGCGLAVLPGEVNFGTVAVGSSAPQAVYLVNNGDMSCRVFGAELADTQGVFSMTSGAPEPDLWVLAGMSHVLELTFTPTSSSPVGGTLGISADDAPGNQRTIEVALSGNAPIPTVGCVFAVTPQALHFGQVTVDEKRTLVLVLRNVTKDMDLATKVCSVQSAQVVDSAPSYEVEPLDIMAQVIMPDMTLELDVDYQPTTIQTEAAILRIESNDVLRPVIDVPLWGSGN